jgi:hypothetical protein
MMRFGKTAALLMLMGSSVVALNALADDANAPPNNAPAPRDEHRTPQWLACRKQADDQKLPRGEARREFMRNCVKNAPAGTPGNAGG